MTASLLRRRLLSILPMALRGLSLKHPLLLYSLPVGCGGGRGFGSPGKDRLTETCKRSISSH